MKNFEKLVDKSFDIMNIEISKKDKDSGENIKNAVKNYYEVLIYNIVSVAVVIALANNTTKLTPTHIEHVKDYIKTKCSYGKLRGGKNSKTQEQTGGTSLPGEYFGYSIDPSRYSAGNGAEESTSTINFEGGIARAAIDTSVAYNGKISGGSSGNLEHFVATNNTTKAYVRDILKRHNLSINKTAFNTLLHMIEIHIYCVLKDLKTKGPLTLAKVEAVFKNKIHAIFH